MFCGVTMGLAAQDSLQLITIVNHELRLSQKIPAAEADNKISEIIDSLHQAHYLEAGLDSFVVSPDAHTAYIHQGRQYQDIWIVPNNQAIAYAQGKLTAKSYAYKEALKLKKELLSLADNAGYPFAEIKFTNIEVEEDKVQAEMQLILNRKVVINSININGDATISQGFLGPYLGLNVGKPLNKSQLLQTETRLRNLPFINSNKAPNVIYNDQGADVYIFADKKQASRFDALIGVLPVNDPLLDQSVVLTATAMIDLVNALDRGERIFFEFKQLRPLTQEVTAQFSYPYFFGLPFGLRSSFELSKQDTSFLDVDYSVGAQYLYGGDNFIEVFFTSDGTRILDVNEQSIIDTRTLPTALDTRTQYYGIQWQFNNLDNRSNPRDGWFLKSRFMLGVRQIRESSLILNIVDPEELDFNFATLYDDLPDQDQFIVGIEASRYQPIGKRSALKIALDGAALFGGASVFVNEQFRVGGNSLLRGFNEQMFFTDRYLVNTLEYRFTLEGNSVLFVFSDLGILQINKSIRDFNFPWGVGAGINFQTAAGVLSLSAAIGQDLSVSDDFFDLGRPKIHIGYVNLF